MNGLLISILTPIGAFGIGIILAVIIIILTKATQKDLEEVKQRKRFLEEAEERLKLRIERTRDAEIRLLEEKERLFNAQAKNDAHMQLLNMTSDKLTKPSDSGAISLIKEDKGDNNDSVTFDELERRLTQYIPGEYTAEDE